MSLCHRCAYVRLTGNTRGSVFLACTAPGMPKYGPQPVLRCPGFQAASRAD
ncbi:MAG: hypothetical protein R3B06_07050 [Kofleriaceae bacterium]